MSSSSTTSGGAGGLSKLWTVASTLFGWGTKLTKVAFGSPALLAVKGTINTGRFFANTILGKAIAVCVILFVMFGWMAGYFQQIERAVWTADSKAKQEVIVTKVLSVNAATEQSQKLAAQEKGWIERTLASAVARIWEVQPQHPIEAETIEELNKARGKPTTPSAPGARELVKKAKPTS